jgi:hypothetical protein
LAAWRHSGDASFELAVNDLLQRGDVHRLEDEWERERWELLASLCGQLKTSRQSFEDEMTEEQKLCFRLLSHLTTPAPRTKSRQRDSEARLSGVFTSRSCLGLHMTRGQESN